MDPVQFWDMTFGDICAYVEGYRKRARWLAMQTYISGVLQGASLRSAFDGTQFPSIQDVFPALFDDLPQTEQKQPWQIMQERIMAHSEDYKRNRGEKS